MAPLALRLSRDLVTARLRKYVLTGKRLWVEVIPPQTLRDWLRQYERWVLAALRIGRTSRR